MKRVGVGCVNISENAKKYVKQALDNQRLSHGPFLSKFENDFARFHDAKYGICCNSGTDALRCGLAFNDRLTEFMLRNSSDFSRAASCAVCHLHRPRALGVRSIAPALIHRLRKDTSVRRSCTFGFTGRQAANCVTSCSRNGNQAARDRATVVQSFVGGKVPDRLL